MSSAAPAGCAVISTGGRRARWTFVAALTGLVVVLMVVAVAANPRNVEWPALAALAVLVAVLDCAALRGRTWIEGNVQYQRRIFTRHADLARAMYVEVRGNRGGGVQLVVRDSSGASTFAELLSLPPSTTRTASPAALQQLADALTGASALEAAAASHLLRLQAQHILAGGTLAGSPLAPAVVGWA